MEGLVIGGWGWGVRVGVMAPAAWNRLHMMSDGLSWNYCDPPPHPHPCNKEAS